MSERVQRIGIGLFSISCGKRRDNKLEGRGPPRPPGQAPATLLNTAVDSFFVAKAVFADFAE